MKPKYNILFIFLFLSSICLAQTRPIIVTTNVNAEGVYSVMGQNVSQVPYYVVIYLTNAENTHSSASLPYVGNIRQNTTMSRLFTISRKDKNKTFSFQLKYLSMQGNPRAKHNRKINYLIPFKNTGATRVGKVYSISKTLGREVADTWNCFSFLASPGDTVYASRRGIVLEVNDNFEIHDNSPFFTVERNSIKMVHKDGTLARYSLFQKNGIFVQPGDEVFAGDPIGTVGGTFNKSVGKIWLMIYQYNQKNFQLNSSFQNNSMLSYDRITDNDDPNKLIYLNPNFITTEGIVKLEENGIYESIHTKEWKQQELSKREIKKLLKKKTN